MSLFVANVAKILTYALWGNDSGSNQVARKPRKLCQPVYKLYEYTLFINCMNMRYINTVFMNCMNIQYLSIVWIYGIYKLYEYTVFINCMNIRYVNTVFMNCMNIRYIPVAWGCTRNWDIDWCWCLCCSSSDLTCWCCSSFTCWCSTDLTHYLSAWVLLSSSTYL